MFIYDLEFSQPRVDAAVSSKNEPDMFAVRFDQDGEIVSICMIEVKSKWSSLTGTNSGLEEHLKGMEKYLEISSKEGTLMDDRKKEACRILNQYRDLGFYGVKKEYREEDFNGLMPEIIFVFSHGAAELDRVIHRKGIINGKVIKNPTVKDVLVGFEPYGKIRSGDYTGDIIAVKKSYDK